MASHRSQSELPDVRRPSYALPALFAAVHAVPPPAEVVSRPTRTGSEGSGGGSRPTPAVSLVPGPPVGLHPDSITGCKLPPLPTGCLWGGCDYFAGTVPSPVLPLVLAWLIERFGPATTEGGGGGMNTYTASHRWDCGAVLAFTPGRAECYLKLSGQPIAALGTDQRAWLRRLQAFGFRATRIDLQVTDPDGGLIDLASFRAAGQGRHVLRFRKFTTHEQIDLCSGDPTGRGVSFGARGGNGGGKHVRVYDKGLESAGTVPGVRLEVEFSADHADAAFSALCGAEPAAYMLTVAALIGGAIDFREFRPEAHHHADRRPRLGWWSRILDVLGSAVLAVHRLRCNLERSAQVHANAYAALLGKLVRVADVQGMDGRQLVADHIAEVVAQGLARLDRRGWSPGDEDLRTDFAAILSGVPS